MIRIDVAEQTGKQVVLDLTKVPVMNWLGLERLEPWVQALPSSESGTGTRLTLRCDSRCLRHQLEACGLPVE